MLVPIARDQTAALLALPPESVNGLPKLNPLILNWTVPAGTPAPGTTADTVALKVTGWPNAEGLTDEATTIEVLALLTVWPPARVPVVVLKRRSPL